MADPEKLEMHAMLNAVEDDARRPKVWDYCGLIASAQPQYVPEALRQESLMYGSLWANQHGTPLHAMQMRKRVPAIGQWQGAAPIAGVVATFHFQVLDVRHHCRQELRGASLRLFSLSMSSASCLCP